MHNSEQQMQALSISRMEAESQGYQFDNRNLQPDSKIVQDLQSHMRQTMKASNTYKKGYMIWLKDYNIEELCNSVRIHEVPNTVAIEIRIKAAARRLNPEVDQRISKNLAHTCQFVHPQLSTDEHEYLEVIADNPLFFRSKAKEEIISKPWHPFPFTEIKSENDVSQI